MFQPLDLVDQFLVVGVERGARLELALDQRLADEHLARILRIHGPVVHAPVHVHRKSVECGALDRHDLRAGLFPVRVVARFFQQMRAEFLQPLRLERRHAAREQARGLRQFGGHDPAAGFLRARTRMHPELDPARAGVGGVILGFHPDVAQQAREQRAVDRTKTFELGRIHTRGLPAEFLDLRAQLAVYLAPLAHPRDRQEMRPAERGELVVGQLLGERIGKELPELQIGKKIRALVIEPLLRLVGGGLLVHRPVTRILHRERRRDHQHLFEAPLLLRREQHARDAWVERQARKLAPRWRQFVGLVDRAQLGEQRIAVRNRARRRRIDKRKLGRIAQVQPLGAQDHRGERRSQHLRVGELGAPPEIVLVIEPNTDPVGHPPAAAGTLFCGGLRDLLHAQLLDLVAVAVALHPRVARVHHIADAGHGQRSLGHVGGEHDAPRIAAGLEHAVLLGIRQPREQRQQVDRPAADRFQIALQDRRGFADLALSRQEHQHVARTCVAQLRDCVDQRGLFFVARGVLGIAAHRPVAHLDRIQAPGHFDHRRGLAADRKVLRKLLRIDRRRSDDQLQVGASGQQLEQIPQQEIDVQAALVRLVDDDRVIRRQQCIALRLGEQDPVGHQLDIGLAFDLVEKPHLVAHGRAELGLQLLRDARRHRACRDPARLRVADPAFDAALHLEQDLRNLRGLARTRLPADHHHLMVFDRAADFVPPAVDRQRRVEFGFGQPGEALGLEMGRNHAGRILPRRLAPIFIGTNPAWVATCAYSRTTQRAPSTSDGPVQTKKAGCKRIRPF